MLREMQPDITREYEFWQSVFTSVALRSESVGASSVLVHKVSEAEASNNLVNIPGMLEWPASVIVDSGQPLIVNDEYTLTMDGIVGTKDWGPKAGGRLLIIKMKGE